MCEYSIINKVYYRHVICLKLTIMICVSVIGCMVCLGRSNYFRFNHPQDAKRRREPSPIKGMSYFTLYFHLFIYLFIYLNFYLFIYLFIYVFIYIYFFYLCIYIFIFPPFIYLLIYLFIFIFFIYLLMYIYFFPFIYLSIYLSIH